MIGFVSRACVIGIAGGTGSGKTTVAEAIIDPAAPELVALLTPATYYQKSARLPSEERLEPSHGRPHAFDRELDLRHIRRTVSGRPISIPVYWFKEYTRASDTIETRFAPGMGLEGKMLSVEADLCALMNLNVFADADSNARFVRRLQRGQLESVRSTKRVVKQDLEHPCPMETSFVETSERKTDATNPHSGHDPEALAMLKLGVPSLVPCKKVGRRRSGS